LNNDNIVFTVKKLVSNFKRDFPLLFESDFKSQGRPKEYYLDELLGFVVYGVYNNRFSCRKLANWINNNDESVNYILNDKKPKKSIIHLFLQEHGLAFGRIFRRGLCLLRRQLRLDLCEQDGLQDLRQGKKELHRKQVLQSFV
jgi:arsenate reductase-like glutaredoxin family protein